MNRKFLLVNVKFATQWISQNILSWNYFQGLQKICAKYDVGYLMDEVQTGGGPTGKIWAHEHFELETAPDIVTFSKKMLTGGIYHKPEWRPKQGYRIFNTWVGDPCKYFSLLINMTQNIYVSSIGKLPNFHRFYAILCFQQSWYCWIKSYKP